MKAMWNGTVLAESDQTIVVEGNHYFPPDSIRKEHFLPSNTHTVCGWKGTASYYTIEVDRKQNADAAPLQPPAVAIPVPAQFRNALEFDYLVPGVNGASCSEILALSPTTTMVICSGLRYSAVSFCTSAGVTALIFCMYVFR